MAMPECQSEFGRYTGDCVWNAVQVGAHKLAPFHWPLPDFATLNRLTSEAIAAGIGVGPRGEATFAQLTTMLTRWGMRYTVIPVDQGQFNQALARNKPVLVGYSNGQALPGDEAGLHGHENALLHHWSPALYETGDGDNPLCAQGILVTYRWSDLVAAEADSALILEEVPGSMLHIQETGGKYVQKQGDDVWTCTVVGHQFDIQHALLNFYREIAPIAGLALPLENTRANGDGTSYQQRFDLWTMQSDAPYNPPGKLIPVGSGPDEPEPDLAGIRADAGTIITQAQDIIKKAGG